MKHRPILTRSLRGKLLRHSAVTRSKWAATKLTLASVALGSSPGIDRIGRGSPRDDRLRRRLVLQFAGA